MSRFGKLGVVANMTLNWAGRDGYTVDGVEGYLDPSVMRTIYPAASLARRSGARRRQRLAGDATGAVGPDRDGDHAGIQAGRSAAVEYEGKLNYQEHLTRLESIKMHTQGAAYQLHLNAGEIAGRHARGPDRARSAT